MAKWLVTVSIGKLGAVLKFPLTTRDEDSWGDIAAAAAKRLKAHQIDALEPNLLVMVEPEKNEEGAK